MLAIALLIAIFNTASSAPAFLPVDGLETSTPLTIFGRDLPACLNIARYRTLQDILWSGLVTIFACVWIAVHPNVPEPTHSGWTNLKQRLMIMVYATLAPECITMWALRQRIGAAKHAKNYNQKFYPGMKPTTPSVFWYIKDWFHDRVHEETNDGLWTVTHGFLLEMRGLQDDAGEVVREVDKMENRVDITEEEINDKSKGDFLTKTLVVCQTTWFIFQCIARWMVRLPVTQLEVITLAFAFLNVITYALWWYKPQNIYVPVPMHRYTKVWDLPVNEVSPRDGHKTGTAKFEGCELSNKALGPSRDPVRREERASLLRSESLIESPSHSQSNWRDRWTTWDSKRLMNKLKLFMLDWAVALLDSQNWKRYGLKWLRLIAKPIEPLMVMVDGGGGAVMSKTFYSSGRGFDNWKASCSMGIVAAIFGGLHLIPAWSMFPSSQERILWQLCAFWITVEPPVLLCASLFVQVSNLDDFEDQFLFRLRLSMFSIMLVGGLLYVLARLVLVVIAFTTLRDLPQDTYRSVVWTTFLPHF